MEPHEERQAQTDYQTRILGEKPLSPNPSENVHQPEGAKSARERIADIEAMDFLSDGSEYVFGNCSDAEVLNVLATVKSYARRADKTVFDPDRVAAALLVADALLLNFETFLENHE